MKQMNIHQLTSLLAKYKSDLEFVNVDVMKWNHDVGDKTPPSREAMLGYALLKCKDHIEYLGNVHYDQYDGLGRLIPEHELTFSLMALATVEAVLLSLGFYSWNAIAAARKKVMEKEEG